MAYSAKTVAASFVALGAVVQPTIPVHSKILQQFVTEEASRKLSNIGVASAMIGEEMTLDAGDEVTWKRGADEVSWKRG
ncbi:MAG: hypothetical protein EOP04_21580 [Proteobacteria bacterium]|nr:MAG: hypothetical protein EOP04_21580 [Pseudomonadota bacterium]